MRRRLKLPYRIPIDTGLGTFQYSTDKHDAFWLRSTEPNLGGWERIPRALFSQAAKNSRVVLDIGSYSGIYGLIALTVSKASSVHLFEPMPQNIARIKKNLRLNKSIVDSRFVLHEAAVSNFANNSLMHFGELTDLSTASLEMEFQNAARNTLAVKTLRLDDLGLTEVDLAKVDVEGH